MLGGKPCPRAINQPSSQKWQSYELDWFMYYVEDKLKFKAFSPPRVPVYDFQAGREPAQPEWLPARYPFEDAIEFVEPDAVEEAPSLEEPERNAP